MKRIVMVVAIGVTLAACGGSGNANDTSTATAVPADVQKAVAVKQGIAAAPTKADSVLKANGLTLAGFDSLMYRIAGDSTLRAAFASAR